MLHRIHVNQHVIRANRKNGENNPPITVKNYKGVIYVHSVELTGPSRLVYSADKPLSCGAHVWIETTTPIVIGHDDQ